MGKEWGHASLSRAVYGNNPAGTTRGTKTHAIWKTVKFLKMRTAHGTTVHNKYTHVCVAPITVSQAGEDGDDQDDDGQWRFFCNKLLTCQKGRTCYKTTMAQRQSGIQVPFLERLSLQAVLGSRIRGHCMLQICMPGHCCFRMLFFPSRQSLPHVLSSTLQRVRHVNQDLLKMTCVLSEDEAQVKTGGKVQFGYFVP